MIWYNGRMRKFPCNLRLPFTPVAALLLAAVAAQTLSAAVPALKHAPEPAGGTGLRVRTLQGAQSVPPVAPKAMFYRFRRGTEEWRETHFNVHELWRTLQPNCRWRDRKGNELVVASLVAPLPVFDADHAKREDVEAQMRTHAGAFTNATDEALADWVAAYADATVAPSALKAVSISALGEARTIDFGRPTRAGALFRLKTGGWHYAAFTFAQPPRPAETARLLRQFLSAVDAADAGSGVVKEGRWLTLKVPGYAFKTDLPESQARAFVKAMDRQMEALQIAYRRYVPPTKPIGESTVRVFATQEGYDDYLSRATGTEPGRTIGLWSPSHEELLILDLGKSDREKTQKTLRHEAFHQYLFYATGGERHAVWFDEGHACFFENVRYDAGRNSVRVTDDPRDRRPSAVGADPAKYAALVPEILMLDHEGFYAGTLAEVNDRYAAAWAAVYFLEKGAGAFEDFAAYRKVLPTYRQAISSGASANEATRQGWETVRNRDFAADFLRFWSKRTAARNYEPPQDARAVRRTSEARRSDPVTEPQSPNT